MERKLLITLFDRWNLHYDSDLTIRPVAPKTHSSEIETIMCVFNDESVDHSFGRVLFYFKKFNGLFDQLKIDK